MKTAWLILFLFLCFLVFAVAPSTQPTSKPTTKKAFLPKAKPFDFVGSGKIASLVLQKIWTLQSPKPGRFDPSGLVYWPPTQSLLTVNDKPNQVKVYSISLQKTTSSTSTKKLQLFLQHPIAIPRPKSRVWLGYRLGVDLEGIAYCGQSLWMVAEQTRILIRIHLPSKKATYHTLNLKEYGRSSAFDRHPMPGLSRDHNASYEGITCDVKNKRLYVIQERQPRLILQVRLPTVVKNRQVLKVVDHFDLPSFFLPKRYGLIDSEPDFSGADMDGGVLYVLYRNARLVLKVDPIRHKLLGVRSYHTAEKDLYRVSKPFGLAEGIVLKGKKIYLVYDNNGKPRWGKTNDRRPVLLVFQRPDGF